MSVLTKFSIIICLLSLSFITKAQEGNTVEWLALCELSKSDTIRFLSEIEQLDSNIVPFDLVAHAAIVQRDLGNLERSDFYFRQALKPENERTFSSASECYLGYGTVELKRAFRKVLIDLKKYDKALIAIGQDKVTFGDAHSSGNSRCVKPWIRNQQAIDSAKCYIGKNEKEKALELLFYNAFFEQECFDSDGHFRALFSIYDSTYVYNEITNEFNNPMCYEFSLGEQPNDVSFIGFQMMLFGNTIKTKFTSSDYETCDEVQKSITDSLIQVYSQSYYIKNLELMMKP
jgi:tetratricopeptide (TPR) repeat protein